MGGSLQESFAEVRGEGIGCGGTSLAWGWNGHEDGCHEQGRIAEGGHRSPLTPSLGAICLPGADVVLLISGAVVVIELKGKTDAEQVDLDQAAAYARDLRCYHRHCAEREVHAVVVPTRARGYVGVRDGVHIAGPDSLHELIGRLQRPWDQGPLTAEQFLAKDAYCPLPTLVQAARELFLRRYRPSDSSSLG